MSEPFVGEISPFGFNFSPRNWAPCDGQLLPISQNTALFSLLGTIYGGDGRTSFGLPDLRGRVMVHYGTGPGLTPRQIGQRSGHESVTLTTLQMPSHNHSDGNIMASSAPGSSAIPSSRKNVLSASGAGNIYGNTAPDIPLNTGTGNSGNAGSNHPHDNMPPWLAVNICIALQGLFPPRN